ncbi:MAG TPA: diacylglycerol kinase family protein [Acidimicrobiales bacterium]|nr:diacylglycerol kinase family protein [Acidimicrobiales bacterium]
MDGTRPSRPLLIVNPMSGGGIASRRDLVGECRRRGIEVVEFNVKDDLPALALAAIERGADVVGMAGGDGSQAAVAAVAAEHDVPYVCIPAGTRNHFAADLGIDRHDVVGALDAFLDGQERRIDLARVNGRVFVNIASLGFYGVVVQSPEYRDAKLRTVFENLPRLIGPDIEPFDLRFAEPDGSAWLNAAVLLVSNNRYQVDARPGRGTRGAIDQGMLGVVAVGKPVPIWREWTAPAFTVDSGDTVRLAVDGEAVALDPPLLFETMPGALRVRVPSDAGRRRSSARP